MHLSVGLMELNLAEQKSFASLSTEIEALRKLFYILYAQIVKLKC